MKSKASTYSRMNVIARYWWLPAAFFGPFILFCNPSWQVNPTVTAIHALRSGLLGLGLACFLYVLWKVDCRLHLNVRPNRNADRIILVLGILLWLVWFTTCQMILIAREEVTHFDFIPSEQ
jgi:hypothetical protein